MDNLSSTTLTTSTTLKRENPTDFGITLNCSVQTLKEELGSFFEESSGTYPPPNVTEYVQEVCEHVTQTLGNQQTKQRQKRNKTSRFIAFIFDALEKPAKTKLYNEVGIYLIDNNQTNLPQGTHCLAAPTDVLDILSSMPEDEFFDCFKCGFANAHIENHENIASWSVIHIKRVRVEHPFVRGKNTTLSLSSSGFAVDICLSPLFSFNSSNT